ncbi:uncharacterized protein PV07_10391 [Cladophialophora immunda]|uniref:Heterokaryon incompatibility domain-containing protein n=1 Tax=Cladophialophora immunda TaxID=569365 RepID=A0A0D2C2I3_9EURO|nr:uncharacterized protein PV07_10391 [Cladophialophora immunda]KIW24690.1 hypothetical protein PV07_10391 [Cladophialophora immunda]
MASAKPEIKFEPGTEGDSSSGTVIGAWERNTNELLPRWEAAVTCTDPESICDPDPIKYPAQHTLYQDQDQDIPLGKDLQVWRHRGTRSRLRDRLSRWVFPKQSTPFEGQSAISLDRLAETRLNSSEARLVEMMKRVVCHSGPCRFWLIGFDPLFLEGSSFYITLRGLVLDSLTSADGRRTPSHIELAETFVALSERSTSWIEDEAICLAIILGLDVGKVQHAIGPERMEVLVRIWESVPRGLFFVRAPRMIKDGLRWMPRSLLNSGLGQFIREYHITRVPALRTERGLQLQAAGVFVSLIEMQTAPDGQLYLEDEVDCYAIITSGIQELELVDFEHDQCAVVFNYRLNPGHYTMAVLVSVTSREDDIIFARYLLRIGALAPHPTRRPGLLEKSRSASFTSSQQKWCVG